MYSAYLQSFSLLNEARDKQSASVCVCVVVESVSSLGAISCFWHHGSQGTMYNVKVCKDFSAIITQRPKSHTCPW